MRLILKKNDLIVEKKSQIRKIMVYFAYFFSCNTIEFVVSVFTDLVEEDLQKKLNSVIYSNSAFAGETIAVTLSQQPLGM